MSVNEKGRQEKLKAAGDRNNRRTALFIDGWEMNHQQRDLGFKMNVLALEEIAERVTGGVVSDAFYYTPGVPGDRFDRFRRFLATNGFSIVVTQLRQGESLVAGERSPMSVEIVHDLLTRTATFDVAVILGAGRDMVRSIRTLQDRGKEVFLIATDELTPQKARELVGRRFVELHDYEEVLKRP